MKQFFQPHLKEVLDTYGSLDEFDGIEIHPVKKYYQGGEEWFEPCTQEENPDFYSVYGHYNDDTGCSWFYDFYSLNNAKQFALELVRSYKNLQVYGVSVYV